jgi:hypothetical protein
MSTCHQTISVDLNRIRQESQIYQLKSDDKLYDYHKAINGACFSEAMKDPTLLKNKHKLQKLARRENQGQPFTVQILPHLVRLREKILPVNFVKTGSHNCGKI